MGHCVWCSPMSLDNPHPSRGPTTPHSQAFAAIAIGIGRC